MKDLQKKPLSLILGDYMSVGLAWATDRQIRFESASGGAVTSLLKYALDSKFIDVVAVPKILVKGGNVYGVYRAVYSSNELSRYVGSIYAPTYMIDSIIKDAVKHHLKIGIVAIPCIIRGLRMAMKNNYGMRNSIRFVLGLYCSNVPFLNATKYAVKSLLKIDPELVSEVSFRGLGWPGYTAIKIRNGRRYLIPYTKFSGCGFGYYFCRISCILCNDHTAEHADISFADPWTYQVNIGSGKTLVVVRSRRGYEVIKKAILSGYLEFEELPSPIYAIQYITLFGKALKVIVKSYRQNYVLPPSITTIIHELDYSIGSRLARNENLWNLLQLYVKTKSLLFKPLLFLDRILKPGFTRVLLKISKNWITLK